MNQESTCPTCGSHDIAQNGHTRRGKQNRKCRACGRQFVEKPQWLVIPPNTKAYIEPILIRY